MNGLGGLNKSPNGVVIGLVQLQLPVVATPADLAKQTETIVAMVAKARRNMPTMDLVVFPEYALHGLSMDTNPAIMCSLDGPEVAAFKKACADNRIWGCFSIMESNPGAYPFNSGVIIDDAGALRLYYRKMHPWVPVEPWEPGDIGIPVIDGPNGSKIALIICHDGMFPEMGRESAYKGAEILIRTAGYTAPAPGPMRSLPRKCAPIWCAKRAGIGRSRTTSTSSVIAVSRPFAAGPRIALTATCRTSSPAAIACPGRRTSCTSTARPADFRRRRAVTVNGSTGRRSKPCPPSLAIHIPGHS